MENQSQRTELEMLAILVADHEVLDEYEVTTALFTEEEYGNLFLGIKSLHEKNENQNKTNLQVALKNLKLKVKKTTLELLFNTKPESSAKLAYDTLLNLWKSREAKKTVDSMAAELATTKPEEVGELLSEGAQKLDIIAQNETIEGSSTDELLEVFMSDLENADTKLLTEGIKTGFTGIDETFNGFKEGQLWVIAGGTGTGKTTFSMNVAYNMAMAGHNVGFLSLEMTKGEMLNKILGIHADYPVKAIEQRNVTAEVIEKVKQLKKFPFFIYEMYARTVNNIVSTLVAIKRKCKAAIIFIDYIGMIAHQRKDNLHAGFGEIIMQIKIAAQRLGIPIVVMAQTHRMANKEGYDIDSIAGSAVISSTAHMASILEYTDDFEPGKTKREMDVKIVKNRLGANFVDVPILFSTVTQKMYGLSPNYESQQDLTSIHNHQQLQHDNPYE